VRGTRYTRARGGGRRIILLGGAQASPARPAESSV
jgi:hypothetical protein